MGGELVPLAYGQAIQIDDAVSQVMREVRLNHLVPDKGPGGFKDRVERAAIANALHTYGSKAQAARELGMSRRNLYYKLKKYGLQ